MYKIKMEPPPLPSHPAKLMDMENGQPVDSGEMNIHLCKSNPLASQEALDYLTSIDFRTIGKAVFNDYLVTMSDTGKEIGELKVSAEELVRDGEICYLIHAYSHGLVDSVPCGTSVTAFVGKHLETLEQTQHEYMKVPGKFLDKKSVVTKQGNEYLIDVTITEGDKVHHFEKCFPVTDMKGFISEGSNFLLQRIFALKRNIPTSALFLCLTPEMELSLSSYDVLPERVQSIGTVEIEGYGVERKVFLEKDAMICWRTYFLPDGHMSSRMTVGSPVIMEMKESQCSGLKTEETGDYEVRDLMWAEDMELESFYIERKEKLMNARTTYIKRHPELYTVMSDFLQFLLLRKPEDICRFAAEYFTAFTSYPVQGNKSIRFL